MLIPRFLFRSSVSYLNRVTVAIAIFDLLRKLKTSFAEPIHLCDIKPAHFGVSESGQVKCIDGDNVFLQSTLGINNKKNSNHF